AAAFLLLLLSYFMQQRTNTEVVNGLQDSVAAMESVKNLMDRNVELEQENKDLVSMVEGLQEQVAAQSKAQHSQDAALEKQKKELDAMDWFWRIQRSFSRGSKRDALALVEQFEASGLPEHLPEQNHGMAEGPSPAEQYRSLLSAMNYQPSEP
ncbi:MAG: hypothetical protein RR403_08200, partial [Pseudoflavonifractor sp.]